MSTKDQFYDQNMKPLLDQLMALAEQGGISIVVTACYAEEGSDVETITGCIQYDSEKNGESVHIVAAEAVGRRPPEFAFAVYQSAQFYDQVQQKFQLEREAAANPHGVAE